MVTVEIQPDLYKAIEALVRNRKASKKTGKCKKGFSGNIHDPFKADRTGLLGELAFSIWSHLEMDTSTDGFDKGWDFMWKGKALDVKTKIYRKGKVHDHDYNMLIKFTEHGRKIPLHSEIYVSAVCIAEDRKNKTATVRLDGWISREEIQSAKYITETDDGTDWNWNVASRLLHPMDTL